VLNKGSREGRRKFREEEENIQRGKGDEFSASSCIVLFPFRQ